MSAGTADSAVSQPPDSHQSAGGQRTGQPVSPRAACRDRVAADSSGQAVLASESGSGWVRIPTGPRGDRRSGTAGERSDSVATTLVRRQRLGEMRVKTERSEATGRPAGAGQGRTAQRRAARARNSGERDAADGAAPRGAPSTNERDKGRPPPSRGPLSGLIT